MVDVYLGIIFFVRGNLDNKEDKRANKHSAFEETGHLQGGNTHPTERQARFLD